MSERRSFRQLREDVERAERALCTEVARRFPPGSVIYVTRGNNTVSAEVLEVSEWPRDPRLKVRSWASGKEYWVDAYHIREYHEEAYPHESRILAEHQSTRGGWSRRWSGAGGTTGVGACETRDRAMTDTRHPLDEVAEALRGFVEWNKRYPSSRVFSHHEIQQIAKELDAIASRARSALSLVERMREAEPVAWAPMLIEELPDGAFYQRDNAPDPGRICAYRTREQAEEYWDETEEVIVPLYALPLALEGAPTDSTEDSSDG